MLAFSLISCQPNASNSGMWQVTAVAETEPVSANPDDDAADDPAIWYNETNPEASLILGSDKKKGLDVFSLDGKRLKTFEVGRINNVDLRQGLPWDSLTIDIVGGSNRSTNGMTFWSVSGDTSFLRPLGNFPTSMPDVYGFCMYKSPKNGMAYAFVNSKTGKVEQWRLRMDGDSLKIDLVRSLQLVGQVEGMVADDSLSTLFVGVEDEGVYVFDAEENGSTEGKFLEDSGMNNPQIKADIEGLAIYYAAGEQGYLIVSSQGNYSYAIFERSGNYRYLGSFEIKDGSIDGVEETDGLEVSHHSFGAMYPSGVFICQDGYNYEGETKVAQNFKMVKWEDIEQGLKQGVLSK